MIYKLRCFLALNRALLLSKFRCHFTSFDKFSKEDWNVKGSMSPLHSLNKLRVPWIAEELLKTRSENIAQDTHGKPLEGYKILDVGCGGGILSIALCRLGADVVAIDESSNCINNALLRAQSDISYELEKGKIMFECSTPDELLFNKRNDFDCVVASEVVEHVNNLPEFIWSCVKLTKLNGKIFITTINKTILSLILAKYISEYILKITPVGIHSHDKFRKPKELEKLLYAFGADKIVKKGMLYNPVNNKWSWIHCDKINYALSATKITDEHVYTPVSFH